MTKRNTVIITVFIIIVIMGLVCLHNQYSSNSSPILEAKVTSDNGDNLSFLRIYNDGKIRKDSSTKGQFVKAIEVDSQIYHDHADKENNSTYLTLDKAELNKDQRISSDPTFVKLISNLVKQSKHLIGILNLFKLDNEYYAFIKYNAGLSDEGTLYKYSNNKLTKICTLDSGKIVGLKKVK